MCDHTINFFYQQDKNLKCLPEKKYFGHLKWNSAPFYSFCTLFIYVKRGLLLSEVSLPYFSLISEFLFSCETHFHQTCKHPVFTFWVLICTIPLIYGNRAKYILCMMIVTIIKCTEFYNTDVIIYVTNRKLNF